MDEIASRAKRVEATLIELNNLQRRLSDVFASSLSDDLPDGEPRAKKAKAEVAQIISEGESLVLELEALNLPTEAVLCREFIDALETVQTTAI